MASQKLTAVWRILTTGRSLEAKMKLMLFIRDFYARLAQDVDETSLKLGEVRTLQALRSVVDNKIEENKNDTPANKE
jgi:hypothetical protein